MILRRLFDRQAAVHVAPLQPAHATTLAALHAEAFARPWQAVDLEFMIVDPMMAGDGIFLGRSRQPCGFALSRVVIDEAEILTVVVARRLQGRGLGRTLLAAHLARLAAQGAKTLLLEVEDGNKPAIALYETFGFLTTGRREGYYAKPDGRRVAAHLMRRISP
jgi:ribosomal-protein-alanine N-acetyltransferase